MSFTTHARPPDGTTAAPPPPQNGNLLLRQIRRAVVFVLGLSVLLVGIVMIVAPGPAVVVIPLGLGILATEFLWARRVLETLKRGLADAHSATSQMNLPPWVRFFVRRKVDASQGSGVSNTGSPGHPNLPLPGREESARVTSQRPLDH